MQGKLLKKIRAGYENQLEKVYMMGREQQAMFQAGLTNYCNFGGHGSGNYEVHLKKSYTSILRQDPHAACRHCQRCPDHCC